MISVIIPTYNHSVSKAVESARLTKDVEIIVVDDASDIPIEVDCCVVRLSKNSGPGVARQAGLNIANGEWITFLDSDDILTTDLNEIVKNANDNTVLIRTLVFEETGGYRNFENVFVHGKLYRKDYLDKNDIHFLPIRTEEDVSVFTQLKCCMRNDGIYPDCVLDVCKPSYYYRHNFNSITKSYTCYEAETSDDYIEATGKLINKYYKLRYISYEYAVRHTTMVLHQVLSFLHLAPSRIYPKIAEYMDDLEQLYGIDLKEERAYFDECYVRKIKVTV